MSRMQRTRAPQTGGLFLSVLFATHLRGGQSPPGGLGMVNHDALAAILEGLESLESGMYPGNRDAFRQLAELKTTVKGLMTPPKESISEAVSTLSTGNENPQARGGRSPYYPHLGMWWIALAGVLEKWGLHPERITHPHTAAGRAYLNVFATLEGVSDPPMVGTVWYSFYQMSSGNWEIIGGFSSANGD